MIIAIISEADAWAEALTVPPGFYKAIPAKASGTSVNDAWHMIGIDEPADGFLIITNPDLIGPSR